MPRVAVSHVAGGKGKQAMAENALNRWRQRWQGANVATIPLRPFGKKPMGTWQRTAPAEQWRDAGAGFRGNIGALMGNGLAVIDCDNTPTAGHVRDVLTGLSTTVNEVATASGTGRHFYLRTDGVPSDFNWCNLGGDLTGELRCRNAYVVAPCSLVGDTRYRFLTGTPETLAAMRPVAWRHLRLFYGTGEDAQPATYTEPPVRLLRRTRPDKVLGLLSKAAIARPGEPITWGKSTYGTRSEAEAAAVAILILFGWQYAEIAAEFETRLPGHFRDSGQGRGRYLWRTYQSALTDICNTPERAAIADTYAVAELAAWPGRGGGLERATYLAMLAIGWQWRTWDPRASQRDLAEHAGASRKGIQNAIKRLMAAGLVERTQPGTALYGTSYHLVEPLSKGSISSQKTQCGGLGAASEQELWAACRLGKSAGSVYVAMQQAREGTDAAHLATATGKHVKTARKALGLLCAYGLAESDGKRPATWRIGTRSLADVAEEVEADRHAHLRHAQHELDRELYRERLAATGTRDRVTTRDNQAALPPDGAAWQGGVRGDTTS